ncbi:MAG: glycosyltransferase family 4 protein [Gemmatimonadota bacterium]
MALLSSYEAWHGGEVVFHALAQGLAARGHEVTLLCRSGSALSERLVGAAGVRVVHSRLRGEGDPRTHAGVARALRRARAEALLTNLGRDLKFGAVSARLLSVPHVHRYAEVARRLPPAPGRAGSAAAVGRPAGSRRKRLERRLLRSWVAGCVTPSAFARDLLLERVPGARPVTVVHNGVDATRFAPDAAGGRRWRAAHGLRPDEPLVGCVGQLDLGRKAQHVLLAAAARALRRPRVVFVGEGADAGELRRLAAELGVEARFTGFEDDPRGAYNGCDVVALPSRQESFGLAVAEAMACGRAVVAARAASIPELLRGGVEGWLVPPDDPAALAAALDESLAAPGLRARRGAAARARVQAAFTIQNMVSGYEAALDAARAGRFAELVAGDLRRPPAEKTESPA